MYSTICEKNRTLKTLGTVRTEKKIQRQYLHRSLFPERAKNNLDPFVEDPLRLDDFVS